MALQFSVFVLLYFATGIITLLLAIYSWKQRSVPGTFWFSLLMLAAAEWCFTFALELLVADPSLKNIRREMAVPRHRQHCPAHAPVRCRLYAQ